MIEIITQIQVEQKAEAKTFIENVEKKIDRLCTQMEQQKEDTNKKIEQIRTEQIMIKDNMTKQIMDYLFDIKKSIDK